MSHSGTILSKLWNASKDERWQFLKNGVVNLGKYLKSMLECFLFFIDLIDFLGLLKICFPLEIVPWSLSTEMFGLQPYKVFLTSPVSFVICLNEKNYRNCLGVIINANKFRVLKSELER